jgi:protein-disulfide isomerase
MMNANISPSTATPWPIRPIILGIVLFAAGILVGYWLHGAVGGASSGRDLSPASLVGDSEDYSWGNASAKVTVVEFGDFECPYCQQWHQQVYGKLKAAYGNSIRFIYRDFPLEFHADAEPAAEAAHCAGEQKRYAEYFELLYQAPMGLDATARRAYAQSVGLNLAAFDQCVASGRYASEIQKDISDASANGVTGTPAFFINGRLLSGAQPFSAFQQVIDSALAQ